MNAGLTSRFFRPAALGIPLLLLAVSSSGTPVVTNALPAATDAKDRTFGLGDGLVVQVSEINSLAEQAKAQGKAVIPFLNGIPLKGLRPEAPLDANTGSSRFRMERTDNSREAWAVLLGKPSRLQREVVVSVGVEDLTPIETTAPPCQLIVIRPFRAIILLVVFVLAFIWFRHQVHRTNMLRDPGPDPGPGKQRPYSLARLQMAFWFFLVVGAFLLIYAVTGGMDAIPNSMLALIGI